MVRAGWWRLTGMMTAVSEDIDALYRSVAGDLLRYATVLVGADAAPDVMTDAFVGATGSRSWAGVVDRRAYLYRCVLNRARSHLRSRSRADRREYLAARLTPPGVPPGPWGPPASGPDVDIVRALRALSARQRAVIYLTYWEDLGRSWIAELLGMSEGSVDQHLSRARQHLRRNLDA